MSLDFLNLQLELIPKSSKPPVLHVPAAQPRWNSIVAIHGLDGHREKTWTAANDTLWLRDLLPADLPNARVLSYGYDADTRSNECVSTNTIYRHAEKFMQELSRKRKGATRVSFDFRMSGSSQCPLATDRICSPQSGWHHSQTGM